MTPLQALEIVKGLGQRYTENDTEYQEAAILLTSLVTPPTADEVCEELERYLPYKVTYDKERWSFNSYSHFGTTFTICQCHENTTISWNNTLKLKVKNILIIARFYEGAE